MQSTAFLDGMPSAPSSGILILSAAVVAVCTWFLWPQLHSPLRRYPGPFLAGCTNLWRLYHAWGDSYHLVIRRLHEQYGPIVRIGPDLLDLDLPELAKKVYNIKGDYKKTPFYHASSVMGPNRTIIYNLFSQTDDSLHAREKRPISKYYSMSGILSLESHMNATIEKLCSELETRFMDTNKKESACDLGKWISYFTWDVVGEVTFGEALGYLEHGDDFNGQLKVAEMGLDYFCVVSQIPILDYWFDKNPIHRIGPPGFSPLVNVAAGHMVRRLQTKATQGQRTNDTDFLDKFIEARSTHPDIVDDNQIVSYLMINMLAGADTTAITIRSVLYYCLRDRKIWIRLQTEVGKTSAAAAFKKARALPYLDACVRESMRMHPPVAMLLERFVPAEGLTLPDGTTVPSGVTVGLNPYIIGRNPTVWGKDVDTFRPERWLKDGNESEEAFSTRLAYMNAADLTFGAGSRECIGRHLGLVETYKLVATLAARYNIELVDPEKEWKTVNSWFFRQEGLVVKLSRR